MDAAAAAAMGQTRLFGGRLPGICESNAERLIRTTILGEEARSLGLCPSCDLRATRSCDGEVLAHLRGFRFHRGGAARGADVDWQWLPVHPWCGGVGGP